MKLIPYLLILMLTGCRANVVEFVNIDFPKDKITEKIIVEREFEDFMVGEILVEPRMMFTHITEANSSRDYYLGLIYHSNRNESSLPVVKSAKLFIDGKEVDRDLGLVDVRPVEWRPSPYNKDLFISSLEGNELFSASKLSKTKKSATLTLHLHVEKATDIEKEIRCNFSARKRSRFLQW